MSVLVLLLVLVLVGVLAGVAGAYGGRWLTLRKFGSPHPRGVLLNAREAAGRANAASTAIENADLPRVLERLEVVANQARKAALTAHLAKQAATDAVRRQDELEQAVAANLAIELRRS